MSNLVLGRVTERLKHSRGMYMLKSSHTDLFRHTDISKCVFEVNKGPKHDANLSNIDYAKNQPANVDAMYYMVSYIIDN